MVSMEVDSFGIAVRNIPNEPLRTLAGQELAEIWFIDCQHQQNVCL